VTLSGRPTGRMPAHESGADPKAARDNQAGHTGSGGQTECRVRAPQAGGGQTLARRAPGSVA